MTRRGCCADASVVCCGSAATSEVLAVSVDDEVVGVVVDANVEVSAVSAVVRHDSPSIVVDAARIFSLFRARSVGKSMGF